MDQYLYLKSFFALAIVLGAFLAVAWCIPKFLPRLLAASSRTMLSRQDSVKRLRIKDVHMLDAKHRFVLMDDGVEEFTLLLSAERETVLAKRSLVAPVKSKAKK